MTPDSWLAVVGGLIAVGGALVAIVRVIVDHTTDKEFDSVYRKISRLERRQAMLEMIVKGDADTFANDD